MKDFDIDNTIENANSEKKAELLTRLHGRTGIPQQEELQIQSRKGFSKVKAFAFGAVGLIAVSVAIVLPISLRNNTITPPSKPKYTYMVDEFNQDDLGITIKEYAETTGKNILYIDWYDIADDCITTKYFLPDDEDKIICISEDLYNGETGDHVCLFVTDIYTDIDILDNIRESSTAEYEYNNTIIKWAYSDMTESTAYFEYDGYKYYFQLFDAMSEQAILDIVKEML